MKQGRGSVDILDFVKQAGGGDGFDKLARANGLEPVQLQAILVTVLPAFAQRMEANTLSRGGVADLVGQMLRPEHSYLLEHPEEAGDPRAAAAGVEVLDTVFGDKAKSRALAAQAAAQTGVDQGLIQKLLPIIASLIMGAIAKGSQGGLQDILRRLPELGGGSAGRGPREPAGHEGTGRREPPSQRGRETDAGLPGGLGDIISRIPGMPDAGGRSGEPPIGPPTGGRLPDYGEGSPLPLPGSRVPDDGPVWSDRGGRDERAPYEKLPDVIRRGDVKVGGDSLSNIVRGVLGSLLGFQSKGVFGWIVRFLVVRWGWSILQWVLRRATGR